MYSLSSRERRRFHEGVIPSECEGSGLVARDNGLGEAGPIPHEPGSLVATPPRDDGVATLLGMTASSDKRRIALIGDRFFQVVHAGRRRSYSIVAERPARRSP